MNSPSCGITPSAVVGHSVGEVSAAYVSGMLSLHDALLVGLSSRPTAGDDSRNRRHAGGRVCRSMSRTAASRRQAIDIAAVNSPSAVTLSGDLAELQALAETLTERGVFNRMLRVEVPYHSRRMDPILDELRTALADLAPRQPAVPLYSSVTGEAVTDALWDADYWCANVREPVRFADVTKTLVRAGHRIFVEAGPHPVLSANIHEILLAGGDSGTTISTLERNRPDAESIRQTVAALYNAGALDVTAMFAQPSPQLELLPVSLAAPVSARRSTPTPADQVRHPRHPFDAR